MARTISGRASELPLAGDVSKSLGDLRVTISKAQQAHAFSPDTPISGVEQNVLSNVLSGEYRDKLLAVEEALHRYRKQLDAALPADTSLGDRTHETKTIERLEAALSKLSKAKDDQNWVLSYYRVATIAEQVESMYDDAGTLPQKLHARMHDFANDVKSQYRTWIILEWTALIVGGVFLPVAIYLFYDWLFQPLDVLITG